MKAPSKPKAKATKAPGQLKAAPKKKVLADHNNSGGNSIVETDEEASGDEVAQLPVKEDSGAPTKKKTASETYVKVRPPNSVELPFC